MSEKIVLIDGYSILHRAFYGLPDLTNAEGLHTNAIYGFLNILMKVLDEEKPDYLVVALDVHAPTFRHKMYEAYKGTRKPMPEELREQIPVLKDVLSSMGICMAEKAGYEADDIIGTIAARLSREGISVTIVSGDRDLLQLAFDGVLVRIPKTKRSGTEIEDYRTADVIERYGVTPAQFIDLKALMGDASDNIPGVPGIGEKTAGKIISSFGSLDAAYEQIDNVTPNKARTSMIENRDLAYLSKELATICLDADIPFDLSSAAIGNFYTPEAYSLFKKLNFKALLRRFDEETSSEKTEEVPVLAVTGKKELERLTASLDRNAPIGLAVYGKDGLLAISASDGKTAFAAYAPMERQITFFAMPDPDALSEEDLAKTARELLLSPDVYTTDRKLLHFTGILPDGASVNDIIIGAYLLNPLKNDWTYDTAAGEYGKLTVRSRDELIGKMSDDEAILDAPQNFAAFACSEAYAAAKCGPSIVKRIDESGMGDLYREIELPLTEVLASMEKAGVRVEKEELAAYGTMLEEGIRELEEQIYEKAGETFNIQSPRQLGEILFEKLGLPSGKKTKSGYSTAASVLEKLAEEHEIAADILRYRQLTKLKSTYADGLAAFIREDGRIHGVFHQTITATGRISSTDPNLQNIPVRMELGRRIRRVFVPADGCTFTDADYSQIELRILASLSGDENLIRAYRENKDIHRITASQVFHVPFDSVTDLQRRNAKAVNFGIVYGISSFGLSQGLSITRAQAGEYIESYFAAYPRVKAYLDETVARAKEDGLVRTLFGRIRPIPELKSNNFMQRQFGERVAMNSPVQGTAADIMKIAMIRAYRALRDENLSSRIVLQVHDELLIETAKGEEEAVRRILTEAMTKAADIAVPLEIDMHSGSNWLEAK